MLTGRGVSVRRQRQAANVGGFMQECYTNRGLTWALVPVLISNFLKQLTRETQVLRCT